MTNDGQARNNQTKGDQRLATEWRDMLVRLVDHMEKETSEVTGEPFSISADNYTNCDRFAAERRVFSQVPLIAGLSVEIPEVGDRLLFDSAGPSITIVRAADGTVNAFLNLCPHRDS